MVPRVGDDHQRRHVRRWNDAEVANLHCDSREKPMSPTIQKIKQLECPRRRAAAPLRKDHLLPVLATESLDQSRHVFRPVLAVGIHHEHGVTRAFRMNEAQPDRNRPLMSQIAPQTQRLNGANVAQSGLNKISGCRRERTIVNEYQPCYDRLLVQRRIQLTQQFTRAVPITVKGKEND